MTIAGPKTPEIRILGIVPQAASLQEFRLACDHCRGSHVRTRPTRRDLLRSAACLLPAAALPGLAVAAVERPRRLRFSHCHTSEKLDRVYYDNGGYLPDALDEINGLLRDFRSGEVHPIDPGLLDVLYTLQQQTGGSVYEVISGYRSPATNEMLRRAGGGGVAKRSLHMHGMAMDVRLQGVATPKLRSAALALESGGVGYYPREDFVHLDTGRVRFW
jgi:uncharacterized protein YcbK (DUF882 family)